MKLSFSFYGTLVVSAICYISEIVILIIRVGICISVCFAFFPLYVFQICYCRNSSSTTFLFFLICRLLIMWKFFKNVFHNISIKVSTQVYEIVFTLTLLLLNLMYWTVYFSQYCMANCQCILIFPPLFIKDDSHGNMHRRIELMH